jgi:hypothetical protein
MSDMIAVAVISTIGMIVSLCLMMFFWILKQEYRHKYLIKRYNLSRRDKDIKNIVAEKPGMLENIAKILPALQNVDLDQLGDLIERFTGGGGEVIENIEPGEIAQLLQDPTIQSIIAGLQSGKQKQTQTQEFLSQEAM